MDIPTITPAIASPTYANRKLKWYHTHKDDPECKARLKKTRQEYYERNKERLRAEMLERYYQKKAQQISIT